MPFVLRHLADYAAPGAYANNEPVAISYAHIDIQNLPEESSPVPNEETPGAFILLNKDDDNGKG